jgi:ATP-dependent RNA helicase DeaD
MTAILGGVVCGRPTAVVEYNCKVLRSSFRVRSHRPPVARPRPAALSVDGEAATEPVQQSAPFDRLGLSAAMLATVGEMGFVVATPIQAGAIPPALRGQDVIGQAHTGSGKTAAFGIPIIEQLDPRKGSVQALILCPTRELAVQVHDEITMLAARHQISSVAIYGGDSMGRQLEALRAGAHIVVATPGRLADHIQRGSLSLSRVRFAVLDEADRMLDMGFAPDVEKILRQCPTDRQTMLFSATMPEWVRRLAMRHMRDPVTVAISVRPEVVAGVRQLYVQTTWADKVDVMMRILDQPDVVMSLIFVETKRTADLLQAQLERRGQSVGVLHGDLTQKERNAAMAAFVATHVKHLIATNVAARGLDIDDISHVINYDVPTTPDEYLHRIGRTARAGRTGVAITLITPSEILKLRDVEKHARTTIEQASLEDFPVVAAPAPS